MVAFVAVKGSVPGLEFRATVINAPWLRVEPEQGVAPATVKVIADTRQLPARNYNGVDLLTLPLATPYERQVAVNLNVGSAQPARLSAGSPSLTFGFSKGDPPGTGR